MANGMGSGLCTDLGPTQVQVIEIITMPKFKLKTQTQSWILQAQHQISLQPNPKTSVQTPPFYMHWPKYHINPILSLRFECPISIGSGPNITTTQMIYTVEM